MKLLEQNVGTVDRTVRIIVGLGLLSLTVVGPQTLWGLIGLLPLATAVGGTCPLYSIFGIRTCPAAPTGPQQGGGTPHPRV